MSGTAPLKRPAPLVQKHADKAVRAPFLDSPTPSAIASRLLHKLLLRPDALRLHAADGFLLLWCELPNLVFAERFHS